MVDILILIDDRLDSQAALPDRPTDALMSESQLQQALVTAFKQAIVTHPPAAFTVGNVRCVTPNEITSATSREGDRLCPLTLNLPEHLTFPAQGAAQDIYQTCRDVMALRRSVAQNMAIPIGDGPFWLPMIWTAKGGLYGEVIGRSSFFAGAKPLLGPPPALRHDFEQPIHLADRWRQPLYRFGHALLRSLQAPPATYLLQFGWQDQQICFDRLFPFPAAPAIASLGVQTPDLLVCHWRCLTHQPILDVAIDGAKPYRQYEP